MISRNSRTGVAAGTPPDGGLRSVRDLLAEASSLHVLMQWVNAARDLISELHVVEKLEPAITAALADLDDLLPATDWGSAESEGLQCLHNSVAALLRDASVAADRGGLQ